MDTTYLTEATCADKETQTEQGDFNKLTNGQSIQLLNDGKEKGDKEKDDKPTSNDKIDSNKQMNNTNVKINNVSVTNEKADTL